MVEVNHAVPAAAYIINNGTGSIALLAIPILMTRFWDALNEEPRMDMVFVECGFTNEDEDIGS